ncbi:polysaccharide lyase family 8 protein [Ceratobasidium sp. AG-Ba]|nr:polysaccharide lyase family 8 protein [Ceratobasidium sp. AG-Ba]
MRALALVWVALAAGLVRGDDIQTVYERSLTFAVASSAARTQTVQSFIDTLRSDGSWSTVDYRTGCDAQRANWPAAVGHWNKITALAAAYHGGSGMGGSEQYVKSSALRTSIRNAMEYWFARDFSTIGNAECLDNGGKSNGQCPCGTPGLWNTNWYSNVILVPTAVGKACLMLRDELSPTEYGNCTLITARGYSPFYRNPQPGYVSGANIIDMSSIGIAAGLLENDRAGNVSRLTDAYQRVHNEVVVHPQDRVDGIKPDGSFQQHIGILYDGNYGKDYSNSLLQIELQAADTEFQANESARAAFGSHIGGAQWMVFADNGTKTLHWDYSVVGRMITFPMADSQATANLKLNLTQIQELGDAWNQTQIQKFARDLNQKAYSANAGGLIGNRMFWNSDYMVHRTNSTITTLKLLSKRTTTSECVNTQNPLGFHLSDGALYQYTTGQEYTDMFATFDFNLVPGITTDYGHTKLECSSTSAQGVETYAGGVSAGDVGVAAMRYVNPQTGALKFRKAWFFFEDNVQHVLITGISATSPAPVVSVLDQRLHNGTVYVDEDVVKKSGNFCDVTSLWHNGTGYVFPKKQRTALSVLVETKTGNWKTIGTSKQSESTKDMFAAWIQHDPMLLFAPTQYTIFPATRSHKSFMNKVDQCTPETLANGGWEGASAAIDSSGRTMGAAFWDVGGGMVVVHQMGLTVFVDRPLVMMLKLGKKGNLKGEVFVADPTHGTGTAHVRILWNKGAHHHAGPWKRNNDQCDQDKEGESSCVWDEYGWEGRREVVLQFGLPTGGLAGSTVVRTFAWSS